MSKVAHYTVTTGSAGLYMPDNNYGAIEFTTRRDLVNYIQAEIAALAWPASTIRQANIRAVWKFIQRNGSSVAHFSIEHKGYALEFHGMTDAEWDQSQLEDAA